MNSAIAHLLTAAIVLGGCAGRPAAVPADTKAGPDAAWIAVSPSVRVNRTERAVEFTATAVIETGFLEQYVCTVGTREHESLFAYDGKASEIHAALLLAGLTPGSPGRWREVAGANGAFAVEAVQPTGEALSIAVRLADGAERPLEWFVRRAPVGDETDTGKAATPPVRFAFGGSRFHTNARTGVERYVADGSGSLIGLVTFGDETISPFEVIPDQAGAATPIWEVDSARIPKPGTLVHIVIRPASTAAARSD